ncbi:MAG: hypothetical protein U9O78_03545, partial [Patescibacteria group bacterium]|nr:hypothetical protein [Patescibacteria group bacterium]
MLSKQACQVLATFIYSSLFNFPLTAKEVELRLLDGEKLASVGFEKFASVRLEKSESNYNSTHKEINKTVEIKKTVQQLAKQGYLFKKNLKQGDYYFPTKFMPQQLPQQLSQQIEPFLLREEKEGWAQLLRADLPALIVLAKRVPWIKGVAITGSLALNSGWKDDDID